MAVLSPLSVTLMGDERFTEARASGLMTAKAHITSPQLQEPKKARLTLSI